MFGVAFSGVPDETALGQDFRNTLLGGGDAALLVAPQVDFAKELKRMNLVQPRLAAQVLAKTDSDQTVDAESNDLRAALNRRKVADQEARKIVEAHQSERKKLSEFVQGFRDYQATLQRTEAEDSQNEPAGPPPEFPKIEPVSGLPEEFADYLNGAVAWHNPNLKDKEAARDAWRQVLNLPSADRRYKSVWAAFMLGKSWEKDDPEKAMSYFSQTRELAKHRFVDSAGLAVASLGLEARIHLKQKRYEQSIELYLAQLAAEDPTAVESLRIVCAEALQQEIPALVPLARNPHIQRVLTAYAISCAPARDSTTEEEMEPPESYTRRWLEAVEKAEVRDVESAEKLALLAYQHNDMKLTVRWTNRAVGSPLAEWLQVKLLLRNGKVAPATTLLARVASSFQLQPRNPTNEVAPESLKDTLVVQGYFSWELRPVERQVLGELGVLHLSRDEYIAALDSLLSAGFWTDAAYVAERVLNLDELKAYVDREWSPISAQQAVDEEQIYGEDPASPLVLRKEIRYLLARRLTREMHGDESREYYPGEQTGGFDALAQALRNGWDESLPAQTRALALFEAAFIARTNGMELLATEVEPDWHVCGGDFQGTLTAAMRGTNPAAKFVTASSDELKRATTHHADPEVRFHYRYQAASLALEAANLMPNDSEQTAYVLWTAGVWLKGRDPQTANLFYKALVRRNASTALGVEANRRRWFPPLDQGGNIIPKQELPRSPDSSLTLDSGAEGQPAADPDVQVADQALLDTLQASTGETSVGTSVAEMLDQDSEGPEEYTVRKGDTLRTILEALNQTGSEMTLEDLLSANPQLDGARLMVGQKLLLPARAP